MKKMMTLLLLTVFCMCVLVSCDLGNGLISELFGEAYTEYPLIGTDDYVVELPDEQWGTVGVPIQTAPPTEETVQEQATEDVSTDLPIMIDPPDLMTHIMYSCVEQIDCRYVTGCEVFLESVYTNHDPWVDPHVRQPIKESADALIISGHIGLVGADYSIFGYSVNGEAPIYAEDFQADPDAVTKRILYDQGADYVNAYRIVIPKDSLPTGNCEIRLWYANYNNEAELASNVEDVISIFELEIAGPTEADTTEPASCAQLELSGFINVTLFRSDGFAMQLMSFGELVDWDGVLNITEISEGTLRFRGYAVYDTLPNVSYEFMTYSWYGDDALHAEKINIVPPDSYDIAVIGSQFEDSMTVFEFTVPVAALGDMGETLFLNGYDSNGAVIYQREIRIVKSYPINTAPQQ